MTTGNFKTILLDSIIVQRPIRQRKELRRVDELAESIASVGLINPPVITPDGILVAGERRLEACRSLGWSSIPVQYTTDLDTITLHLIELEENVKREDLTWQEHNDAIARYHELKKELDPAWSATKTADALGVDKGTISKHLSVAEVRKEQPEEIQTAETFSTAVGLAKRRLERKAATTMRAIAADAPITAPTTLRFANILNTSFLDWSAETQGQYNFIHCDFPYGVSTGDKKGQSAAKRLGSYDDGEDVYWSLVEALTTRADNFIADSAHLLFWFSMKFYTPTIAALSEAGWRVDPFPFIWHKSDGAGIIPDPNRGPRRTYETALFASRGDRKIIRPVANSFSGPTTKEFHTSEKPAAMLEHFFRMIVDDTTRMLDPTCGSGMSVKVAEAMGASTALGLEINEEFAEGARRNLGL